MSDELRKAAQAVVDAANNAGMTEVSDRIDDLRAALAAPPEPPTDLPALKFWRAVDAAAPAAPAEPPKDHEIREAVSALTNIARKFHATGQLRVRIASVVLPLVRLAAVPAPVPPAADPAGTRPARPCGACHTDDFGFVCSGRCTDEYQGAAGAPVPVAPEPPPQSSRDAYSRLLKSLAAMLHVRQPKDDGMIDSDDIKGFIAAVRRDADVLMRDLRAAAVPVAPPTCPICRGSGIDGDVADDGAPMDVACSCRLAAASAPVSPTDIQGVPASPSGSRPFGTEPQASRPSASIPNAEAPPYASGPLLEKGWD